MTYAIDKKVPLPRAKSGLNRACHKYPFDVMEKGDSFAVPLSGEITTAGKNAPYDKALVRVRSAASNFSRRRGRKFTVRTLKDEGVVRCWRVK